MIMQRPLTLVLGLALLAAALPVAEGYASAGTAPAQPASPPAAAPQDQQPSSARPAPPPQQTYSEREVHPRRHSHVTKKEIVFMGAIAGTSMGIGAIAGGGTGLAIGAIVGGWSAYAGHRLWRFFNK